MEPVDPAEKLLSDIQYWEEQERDAQKRLRYAKAILPGLREGLKELRREGIASSADVESARARFRRPAVPPENREQADPEGARRLRGQAEEQVEQALRIKPTQSSKDLVEFLETHGRKFSRGAVDLALRRLGKAGKVKEVKKVGNLRFYDRT